MMERMIDLKTHTIYTRTNGVGKPPVIFEAGMNNDSNTWRHVEPKVAEFTTTVVYDRAGLGRSSQPMTTRTLNTMLRDLGNVLEKLEISPPYILVGHSLGGLLVRLYAASNLANMAGLILVDAPHERQHAEAKNRLSAKTWELVSEFWQQSAEAIDLAHEFANVGPVGLLGNLPLVVLSATVPETPPSVIPVEMARELHEVSSTIKLAFQQKLAAESSCGQHILVEGAGHDIHWQRPDVVIEAIHTMVLSANA